mgnify:CR=1 FL=1
MKRYYDDIPAIIERNRNETYIGIICSKDAVELRLFTFVSYASDFAVEIGLHDDMRNVIYGLVDRERYEMFV